MININLHLPIAQQALVFAHHLISGVYADFVVIFLNDDTLPDKILRNRIEYCVHTDKA